LPELKGDRECSYLLPIQRGTAGLQNAPAWRWAHLAFGIAPRLPHRSRSIWRRATPRPGTRRATSARRSWQLPQGRQEDVADSL